MTIVQVHSVFKERFNRLASDYHQDLSTYQIDTLINDAMHLILEKHSNNESNTKFINLIASLIYSDSPKEVIPVGTNYLLSIDDLTFPFYKFERIVAHTNCGNVDVQLETYGRIGDLLSDAFRKPSKRWKRLLGVVREYQNTTNRELVIYSEQGFIIESVSVEYIRYPENVFFGNYDSPSYSECIANGGDNCDQYDHIGDPARTIDLQSNYHTTVIDYAVQEALRSLGLGNEFALRQNKIAEISN